ncbi:MAG: arginine deiminase family protein, partial [Acidimicrobiia bacterium]
MVHRPGDELRRVTPATMDELLFDELLWVERAAEEHDAFTAVLRAGGAEVLYLADLLTELLTDRALAVALVSDQVGDDLGGRRLGDRLRGFLLDRPPPDLVRYLIGGVTVGDLGVTGGLVAALTGPSQFLLPPLPNTVFTRDSSVWIDQGVVLAPMNRTVRRRETALLAWLYRHHPRFAQSAIWFGDAPGEHFPSTVEGGDLLVLSNRGMAVGVSERTSPPGAAALASRLFEQGVVDRILVVVLPLSRATMHLDTVVS